MMFMGATFWIKFKGGVQNSHLAKGKKLCTTSILHTTLPPDIWLETKGANYSLASTMLRCVVKWTFYTICVCEPVLYKLLAVEGGNLIKISI